MKINDRVENVLVYGNEIVFLFAFHPIVILYIGIRQMTKWVKKFEGVVCLVLYNFTKLNVTSLLI